jgi:tRNA threonylcarbamoyladenosine biosynthesis protein TsaE
MVQQALRITLADEQATRDFGMDLGQCLTVGTVLLLQGDLGTGKTTLIQGLGQGLGITDPIVSPTFILLNEYLEGRVPLYHFDLYRLEPLEVEALHLEHYWEGTEHSPGIVAIEWAERLPYKPAEYIEIHLAYSEAAGRQATLTGVGGISEKLWELSKNLIKA